MEVSDGASTSKPHSSLAGQQPLLILLTHPNASQLGTWVQGPREKAVVSASNRSPGHEGKYPSSQSDWQDGSLAAAPYDPIHDDAAQFANLPRSVPPATKISLGLRMPHRLAAHHCKQPSLSVFSRRNSIRSPCYKFHLKSPPPGCCLPAGVFGSTKTSPTKFKFSITSKSHRNIKYSK